MTKLERNRNITRAVSYDADGNQKAAGWMVRFNRRGKSYQAFFGDHKHGGEKKALTAARADRDEKDAKYRQSTPLERLTALQKSYGNKTVGVRWAKRTITRGKKVYHFTFATASWTDIDGARHTCAFSILKYGKKEAWDLACKARAKGISTKIRAYKKALEV